MSGFGVTNTVFECSARNKEAFEILREVYRSLGIDNTIDEMLEFKIVRFFDRWKD